MAHSAWPWDISPPVFLTQTVAAYPRKLLGWNVNCCYINFSFLPVAFYVSHPPGLLAEALCREWSPCHCSQHFSFSLGLLQHTSNSNPCQGSTFQDPCSRCTKWRMNIAVYVLDGPPPQNPQYWFRPRRTGAEEFHYEDSRRTDLGRTP